jgi:hypothetical protein
MCPMSGGRFESTGRAAVTECNQDSSVYKGLLRRAIQYKTGLCNGDCAFVLRGQWL